MKVHSLAVALVLVESASAFCSPQQKPRALSTSLLASSNKHWFAPAAAAAALGWTLAAQIAVADMPNTVTTTNEQVMVSQQVTFSSSSSALLAELPPNPEPTFQKLDFSLPSYDATIKGGGFGDTEAILNKSSDLTDPGAGEAEKQRISMEKAEVARKERLAKQKEEQKQREAEGKIRAQKKKEERERRMKGIFE